MALIYAFNIAKNNGCFMTKYNIKTTRTEYELFCTHNL
ncbi:hypothetical protein CZ797_00310 [Pseudoalteromonas sp. JB197]|nr:hypothetical protein CZ797_00310 [Pseudoalteromonas sp. JB197]